MPKKRSNPRKQRKSVAHRVYGGGARTINGEAAIRGLNPRLLSNLVKDGVIDAMKLRGGSGKSVQMIVTTKGRAQLDEVFGPIAAAE